MMTMRARPSSGVEGGLGRDGLAVDETVAEVIMTRKLL
jgi:hypothetical protein